MLDKWTQYKESAEKAAGQHKLEHAESLWYAALQEAEDFEPNDPRRTVTLEALAEILFKQRKYAQAEQPCIKTIEIYERTIGPDHPDVGILANNLAMLYHMQKKWSEAESWYKKALAKLTKSLGSKHPEVINLLGNYSNLLMATHREAEAEHMRACARSASTGKWTRSGRFQALGTQNAETQAIMPQPAQPAQAQPAVSAAQSSVLPPAPAPAPGPAPLPQPHITAATQNPFNAIVNSINKQGSKEVEMPPSPPPLPEDSKSTQGTIQPASGINRLMKQRRDTLTGG